MAININELYKFVQFISNKEQSGYIKPSEFNMAVDRAQMQLFMERYNNPAEYQPGRPVPRVTYQQTQKISDDLKPFIRRTFVTLTNGRMLWTDLDDYMHLSSVRAEFESTNNCGGTDIVKKGVRIVDDSELSHFLDSAILKPTGRYPVAAIYDGFLQIYPEDITEIEVTYLTRPNRPADGQFWKYTAVNGLPNFDLINSTNLNWSDELFNEIAIRILSFIGINLREVNLSQYAEMKKQQGI